MMFALCNVLRVFYPE